MKVLSLAAAILVAGVGSSMAQDDATPTPYNSSSSDSVTIGSDSTDGSATQSDAKDMGDIQRQMQETKDRWPSDVQRDAVEGGKQD
jgi:hypothetical protein